MGPHPGELLFRFTQLADAIVVLATERKWSQARKKNYIVQSVPGFPMIKVAAFYYAMRGNEVAAWRAFAAATVFDLRFVWRTREACVKEVYGPDAE